MSIAESSIVVYFDGSCPLCRAEINHYKGEPGADRLVFVDASEPGAPLGHDLSQTEALNSFHIRRADGTLLSGASAFVVIWAALPRWQWVARLASLPGVPTLLEWSYRASLWVRPLIAWMVDRRACAPCDRRGQG